MICGRRKIYLLLGQSLVVARTVGAPAYLPRVFSLFAPGTGVTEKLGKLKKLEPRGFQVRN